MFPEKAIKGFEQYWRRRKPGSSTAIHYTSDVRIFFRWVSGCAPEMITVHDIDRFIEWQQSLGRASATVRRRLIALRTFYDYLAYAKDRDIENPIIPRRHYVSRTRYLPRNVRQFEIEKLFTAVGGHLRDRTIFTLMLHSGLRIGEILNLQTDDLYFSEKRTPHVRVNGKGQRERIVYLSLTATQLLKEYLLSRPSESGKRIFLNNRGKPITTTGIQLQLAKYCRLAGIWITCHQLRHTFASRMIAAGIPVTSVQKMLGHVSLRTTQLYVEIADLQVEQDYQAGIQKVTTGDVP